VLTKAVEAPAALSKALSAENVDAMWAERCGSDSPASDEAAGGGGVMSGIKSMSSAAADGAALVTTGVASGLQAVFGEDIDKSDAGLEAAFAKKWRSHPREHGTIDAAKMKAYIQSVYEDGLDDKTICAMMAGAPGTSTDGKLGIDDFKLIMRAGPKKKATRGGGIGSAVTSAVDAGVDATVGGRQGQPAQGLWYWCGGDRCDGPGCRDGSGDAASGRSCDRRRRCARDGRGGRRRGRRRGRASSWAGGRRRGRGRGGCGRRGGHAARCKRLVGRRQRRCCRERGGPTI
jgi:hypothetical protein